MAPLRIATVAAKLAPLAKLVPLNSSSLQPEELPLRASFAVARRIGLDRIGFLKDLQQVVPGPLLGLRFERLVDDVTGQVTYTGQVTGFDTFVKRLFMKKNLILLFGFIITPITSIHDTSFGNTMYY